MTNPLFKVTLALLSLISAVLIGQSLIGPVQHAPVMHAEVNNDVIAHQHASLQSTLPKQAVDTPRLRAELVSSQASQQDHGASAENASNRQQSASQNQRRSFSFHYLDILEWLFANRGEKAKHQQQQRPSTSLSIW